MQSALSSLHSHARNGATPQAGQGAPTPSAATPDLDPLRLRLVQLIDAVTTLHTHLSFLAFHSPSPSTLNPGLPAFSDLVARYNTLLTHLTALQGLVSSQQDRDKDRDRDRDEGEQGGALGRRRRQDRDRDLKREKWDALAVVPTDKVDESRDWIVGMLLRTKQTPDVETSQTALVKSLPEPFASALSSSSSASSTLATTTSTSAHPAAPPPSTTSPSFAALAASHARLVSLAHDRLAALKEFNSASEEWDWKARVELDDDNEEEEEEEGKGGEGGGEGAERGPGGGAGGKVDAMQVDGEGAAASGSAGPRAWTPREVQAFMRTGVKPVM
ncbi:hypothetical protein JCM9279_001311 [Rhodotorula babjevae]